MLYFYNVLETSGEGKRARETRRARADPAGGVYESNAQPSVLAASGRQGVREDGAEHVEVLCEGLTSAAKRCLMSAVEEIGPGNKAPPPMMVFLLRVSSLRMQLQPRAMLCGALRL